MVPQQLLHLVRDILLAHYLRNHKGGNANAFADTLIAKLFGPDVTRDANQAVSTFDVADLPWLEGPADELQKTLSDEIRRWLINFGPWRFNVEQKSLAYARALAGAVGWEYETAISNARRGHMTNPDDNLPSAERAAIEAERRYEAGRRRW